MNDKEIMEGILLTTKGVCDLYMHGSIESATPNVHEAFNTALNDSLCMQDGIYKQMASRGWYPSEQAPQRPLSALSPCNSIHCRQLCLQAESCVLYTQDSRRRQSSTP